MHALKRRATFKFSEQDNDNQARVLDEQEQDDVIADLRKLRENTMRLQHTSITLLILISATMQIAYISSEVNPLLMIFPAVPRSSTTAIPFSAGFTLLSLIVHLNFVILLHPRLVGTCLQLRSNPKPLPYSALYVVSAFGPMLSLLLRLPWQTTTWWSFTAIIVFVVQSAMDAAESSSRDITKLESMRYVAPGA